MSIMNAALPIPMSPSYTHRLCDTVSSIQSPPSHSRTTGQDRTGQEHGSSMSCGAIRDRLEIKQWVEEGMIVV